MADAKVAAAEKAVRLSLSKKAFIISGILFLLGSAGVALETGVVNSIVGTEVVTPNDLYKGIAIGVMVTAGAAVFGTGIYHESKK